MTPHETAQSSVQQTKQFNQDEMFADLVARNEKYEEEKRHNQKLKGSKADQEISRSLSFAFASITEPMAGQGRNFNFACSGNNDFKIKKKILETELIWRGLLKEDEFTIKAVKHNDNGAASSAQLFLHIPKGRYSHGKIKKIRKKLFAYHRSTGEYKMLTKGNYAIPASIKERYDRLKKGEERLAKRLSQYQTDPKDIWPSSESAWSDIYEDTPDTEHEKPEFWDVALPELVNT